MRKLYNINPSIFGLYGSKHSSGSNGGSKTSGGSFKVNKVEFDNVHAGDVKTIKIDSEVNNVIIYKKQPPREKILPTYLSIDDFKNPEYITLNTNNIITLKTEDQIPMEKVNDHYECNLPSIDFDIIGSISIDI